MTTQTTDQELRALTVEFDVLSQDHQRELIETVDAQVAPLLHQHAGSDPRYLNEVRRLLQAGERHQAMAWMHWAEHAYFNAL